MIDELDKSIEKLLQAELKINNGQIDIRFDQPKREWSTRINRPTVNFYLYDVRENVTLRTFEWQRLPNGTAGDHKVRQKLGPFRIDCFYVLTTWVNEPREEHRLLSRCLNALLRHPILPKEYLDDSLANSPHEIQARLAKHDQLTNPAELWGSLDNEIRPSVPYVITLTFDPWQAEEEEMVRRVDYRIGQADELPDNPHLTVVDQVIVAVGGRVFDKDTQELLPDIIIRLKGTARTTKTDKQGRYRLGGLSTGGYTLIAIKPDGTTAEREITVADDPTQAPVNGYDIEV